MENDKVNLGMQCIAYYYSFVLCEMIANVHFSQIIGVIAGFFKSGHHLF
jgi:hypothetical protein